MKNKNESYYKIINPIKKNTLKSAIAREIVVAVLRCHGFCHRLAGMLSKVIEPNGIHPKHRLTDYHDWFIEQIKPEWVVLDVGCEDGTLTADLVKHCKNVTGIDISLKNINKAKGHIKAEFICGDVTKYSFNRIFNAIVLSNVLEHIEDRISFLKNLLHYSDIFLIRVPMIDRDWITLYKRELGVEYRLDPGHFIEYTLEDFIKELNEAGLKVDRYRIRYGEIYAIASSFK
jgi:SAM-dependent methyltransferase